MRSYTYLPRPPLSNFVELFWYVEGWDLPHAKERLFPTGRMELVIDLSGGKALNRNYSSKGQAGKNKAPLLSGAYSEFSLIGVAPLSSLIGVQFKPGGSFPFFTVPAGELHNKRVPLEELWGTTAAELQERLLTAPAIDACFRLLEQALQAQTAKPLRLHGAVAYALDEFQQLSGSNKVAEVIDRTGLSSRRFIQLFCEQVGLTPKLFCRVQRFQQSLRTLAAQQSIDWADLAHACGYYDQAHFINEFRTFTGLNPTAYLAGRGENPNHLPLFD